MIAANELRVGNWYTSTKWQKPVRCELSDIAEIHHRLEGAEEKYANVDEIFQSIPLSKEWLKKFGFKKREGNNICWDLGNFMVGWYGNSYATWVVGLTQENNELFYHSQIKSVHQLQNLYFSLTGEELTITE